MGFNRINLINADHVLGGVSSGLYRSNPWHGLGDVRNNNGDVIGVKRPLDDDPRRVDIIAEKADLTWEPQELHLADVVPGLITDRKMLVRSGWPTDFDSYDLGVHSGKYGVITNEQALGFVEEILRVRPDAMLQSVTTLYGGRIVFANIAFPEEVKVRRRNGTELDKSTPLMGVYWSHDGSHPLGVKFMSYEWVCENTFTPWLAETGLVVRHTRYAEDRAKEALLAIEGMVRSQDQLDREIERLLDIELSKGEAMRLLKQAVIGFRPEEKKGSRAAGTWDTRFDAILSEWADTTDGSSAFDFVMAVQGYEQHRQPVRGGGREVKNITRLIRDDFPMTKLAASAFAGVDR